MASTLAERLAAHARFAHQTSPPPPGETRWTQPRADILSSWTRCTSTGLDLARPPAIEVVSSAELARRREEHDFVRRLALAELETLQQQIAGSNFLLAFADREGVILDLYADHRFAMSGKGDDILLGSCWSEAARGTNGLGTALAIGHAVAVTGPEHYFIDLQHVSCTASPVRDAHGQVVGVLDASSYFDSRQRHTQALVQMAASQIENRLLVHQMREHWVLAIHPRTEFLGTLSAGLLAFDGGGRLAAANERARALLSGLELDEQTRFEELFREPLEHVLGRLRHKALGTELRLCDALGSVLYARCVAEVAGDGTTPRSPAGRTTRSPATTTTGGSRPAHPAAGSTAAAPRLPSPGPLTPIPLTPSRRTITAPATPHAPIAPTTRATLAATAAADGGPGDATPAHAAARRLLQRHEHLRDFVIDDAQVQEALSLVGAAVLMQAPILIRGESGSGKEMLARHAHAMSGRQGEFVAVNCAALPTELFEAELFGYVGGAYTGARREGDVGLIVSADGGTLLLDEIRELGPTAQAALLRFLDDQQVRPVGGHSLRRVNVQLLAATHADLEAEVAARRFRADLFYRLNTVAVTLPPLRARTDLDEVVEQMLGRLDEQAQMNPVALDLLRRQRWPGNFRELRAVLTRALLRCGNHHIEVEDVARSLGASGEFTHSTDGSAAAPHPSAAELVSRETRRAQRPTGWATRQGQGPHGEATAPLSAEPAPSSALQQGATSAVLAEYQRTGGSVSATSRNLGISRTTVYRHLRLAEVL